MYPSFMTSFLTLSSAVSHQDAIVCSGIAVLDVKNRIPYHVLSSVSVRLCAYFPDRCDLQHGEIHMDINVVLGFQSTRNVSFIACPPTTTIWVLKYTWTGGLKKEKQNSKAQFEGKKTGIYCSNYPHLLKFNHFT